MTTNLGNQAQTGVLIATTQVRSPSFSQPYIALGSADAPSPFVTISADSGINKYVFYSSLTSGSRPQGERIIGRFPDNFFATHTVTISITAVASTSFDTPPRFQAPHQYIEPAFLNAIRVNVTADVAPVFSTGTAYVKVVVTINKD